jgi:hypothetical protein
MTPQQPTLRHGANAEIDGGDCLRGTPSRIRPYDEQGGKPITVDLAWLTAEQRKLWYRHFSHLEKWRHGAWCQATCLELLNFGYICMLEDEPPIWPPRIRATLREYGRMVRDYAANSVAAGEREQP